MLLAILPVHCCAANATVAAIAQAANACDDAMLTCLQIIYVVLIVYNLFMKNTATLSNYLASSIASPSASPSVVAVATSFSVSSSFHTLKKAEKG